MILFFITNKPNTFSKPFFLPQKQLILKFSIFAQNHGLTPLENTHFFNIDVFVVQKYFFAL